jgi:hypothetical protein
MKLFAFTGLALAMTVTPIVAETWYQDLDNDGYGNSEITIEADTQPLGFVLNNIDCDDTDIDIYDGCSVLRGNSQVNPALAGGGLLLVLGLIGGMGGGSTGSTGSTSGTN